MSTLDFHLAGYDGLDTMTSDRQSESVLDTLLETLRSRITKHPLSWLLPTLLCAWPVMVGSHLPYRLFSQLNSTGFSIADILFLVAYFAFTALFAAALLLRKNFASRFTMRFGVWRIAAVTAGLFLASRLWEPTRYYAEFFEPASKAALLFLLLHGVLHYREWRYSKGFKAFLANARTGIFLEHNFRDYTIFVAGIVGILSAALTYAIGWWGFRWDEHFLAHAGALTALGKTPYRDFGLPSGPLTLYVQAMGHWLFPFDFKGYGVSAAIVNGSALTIAVWWMRRCLRLTYFWIVPISLLLHFTLFGMTGALWYNQFAGLWLGSGLLLLARIFILEKRRDLKMRETLLLSALATLALLSKQDYGILAWGFFGLWVILFVSNRRLLHAGLLFGLPLAGTIFILSLFSLAGGEPFYWINYGQEGYFTRSSLVFHPLFFRHLRLALLYDADFTVFRMLIPVQVLLLLHTAHTSRSVIELFRKSHDLLLFAALFSMAFITRTSSGPGSGFAINFLSVYALLLTLIQLRAQATACSRLAMGFVAASLIGGLLCFAFAAKETMFDRTDFQTVSEGPLKGYHTSEATRAVLERYNREIRSEAGKAGRPLTAYVGCAFQFMHPDLDTRMYGGSVFPGYVIVVRDADVRAQVQRIVQDPPELFVHFPDVAARNWGPYVSEIQQLLADNYTLRIEGQLDLIGTGGMKPAYAIQVYFRNP